MYLLEKINEMKVRFDKSGELSSSDRTFIESNYERILSKQFNNRGCGQCYQDAFVEIFIYVKKNGIKDMGKFNLKREEVLHITGDSKVYTRANIKDEVAISYLRQFPDAISRFETYPEDWEDIVSGAFTENDEDQDSAEKELVLNIIDMLKAGTSKSKIKDHYKSVDKVGRKDLTGVLVGNYIKQAEQEIKAEQELNTSTED